jgi:hypothetical protein
MQDRKWNSQAGSRRAFIRAGLGVAAAFRCPPMSDALAADHPPIGTFPAGVQGKEVFIGVAVPRTGTYAEQGEDELKGWQLAVEHINTRQRPDPQDLAQDQEGRDGQGSSSWWWPTPPPSRTTRCRPSSASSPRSR